MNWAHKGFGVTAPAGAAAPATTAENPLSRLQGLLGEDMAAVDTLIAERMESRVGTIPDLASHLVEAGGKRLRPMITVAAARLCGYGGAHHHRLAATVELIHTATLLHDDVVDGSELRRGKPPANLVWGNAPSVLVGDFLFARAFSLMVETESLRVLEILSRASSVIAEGEVAQLMAVSDVTLSQEGYLDIIEAKTAELFAAAAHVGAVVAGAPPPQEAALERYGRALGIAFQLVDDALDYGGVRQRLGKNTGDDFREGKVTLPVVFALRAGNAEERAFWARVMGGEQAEGDFDRAVAILERHGAIAATLELARTHAATAYDALDDFPASPLHAALRDLTAFVVERAT